MTVPDLSVYTVTKKYIKNENLSIIDSMIIDNMYCTSCKTSLSTDGVQPAAPRAWQICISNLLLSETGGLTFFNQVDIWNYNETTDKIIFVHTWFFF